MADQAQQNATPEPVGDEPSGGGAAVAVKTRPAPAKPRVDQLPPWKVLLHNDEKNTMEFVVRTIMELARLNEQAAIMVMIEAHKSGLALLLSTHREHAELLPDQFPSKRRP